MSKMGLRSTTVTLLIVTCVSIARAQRVQGPLPFDTVGASRGIPPDPYAMAPNVKWLAGDTVIWTRVTGRPSTSSTTLRFEAWATDTSFGADQVDARRLRFASCPFELSLYDAPERTGNPVWQSAHAAPAVACPIVGIGSGGGAMYPFSLRGGLQVDFGVPAIMGDSLRQQRYFFRYAVRLGDGRRLEYKDGDAYLVRAPPRETRDRSALRFTTGSAMTSQFPRTLRVWMVVKNGGTDGVILDTPSCALRVRLWRTRARTGEPAWSSESGFWWDGSVSRRDYFPCQANVNHAVIMPNDTLAFDLTVPEADILKDSSVAEGAYWVSADLAVMADTLRPLESTTRSTFEAGAVTLSRAADLPPPVRQNGPLRIEAATRLMRGRARDDDSVHVFVLMTNTGDSPTDVRMVRGNPLFADLYSSAPNGRYGQRAPAYTISPGLDRGYLHAFSLGAKQKWLFEASAAVKDIVAKVGPGRMYVFTSLWGAWPTALAAGEIDLP